MRSLKAYNKAHQSFKTLARCYGVKAVCNHLEKLEDLTDAFIADQRLRELQSGKSHLLSYEELLHELDN